MNKFINVFLGSLVVISSIAICINFYFDPAGIFHNEGRKEFQLANTLANKNLNVLVGFNYDERLFQLFRIKFERSDPEVIVIGSSRSMQISSKLLEKHVLNLSVSSAGLEDLIGISIKAKKKFASKIYFLGVDPWIFNEFSENSRWRSIAAAYRAGANEIGLNTVSTNSNVPSKYLQLVNYDYTKQSLSLWGGGRADPKGVLATQLNDNPSRDLDLIRVDGSRVYNLKYSNRVDEIINNDAIQFATSPKSSLKALKTSAIATDSFLKLIDYLSRDSVVIVFLSPFHPTSYSFISKNYPEIEKIEMMIKCQAAKRNVRVVGSYNPTLMECNSHDFYDGMHARDECLRKIFSKPNIF